MSHYFKYVVPNRLIHDKLTEKNYKRVNFYIDLASIARGFFNMKVVTMEIANYAETRQPPTIFINELKEFLTQLYRNYQSYNPRFVIFYDTGHENQNRNFDSVYKSDKSGGVFAVLENEELQLFREIKSYYFNQTAEKFNVTNVSRVIYLKNVETDYIPYYILSENLMDSGNPDIANIILSVDKDLLQTCQFPNCYQAISVYLKSDHKVDSHLFDDETAIAYIYKNFKRGFLTSKYIPLLLAMAGDKADMIPNLYRGLGFAKACDLILQHNLEPVFNSTIELPRDLEPYKSQLLKNLGLTSFELQVKRVPFYVHTEVKEMLKDF